MIKRVIGLYFSPVAGTDIMTERLASELSGRLEECSAGSVDLLCLDLNSLADGTEMPEFDEETVVIIGMPSYIGKLPLQGVRALRTLDGGGAMMLGLVSYGGRSYGDALYELRSLAEKSGFKAVGAGAFFISYRAVRGSSRMGAPSMDLASLIRFGEASASKISRLAGCEIDSLRIKPAPLEVSGRMPVHKISRIFPKAAAAAQSLADLMCLRRNSSEWFL